MSVWRMRLFLERLHVRLTVALSRFYALRMLSWKLNFYSAIPGAAHTYSIINILGPHVAR